MNKIIQTFENFNTNELYNWIDSYISNFEHEPSLPTGNMTIQESLVWLYFQLDSKSSPVATKVIDTLVDILTHELEKGAYKTEKIYYLLRVLDTISPTKYRKFFIEQIISNKLINKYHNGTSLQSLLLTLYSGILNYKEVADEDQEKLFFYFKSLLNSSKIDINVLMSAIRITIKLKNKDWKELYQKILENAVESDEFEYKLILLFLEIENELSPIIIIEWYLFTSFHLINDSNVKFNEFILKYYAVNDNPEANYSHIIINFLANLICGKLNQKEFSSLISFSHLIKSIKQEEIIYISLQKIYSYLTKIKIDNQGNRKLKAWLHEDIPDSPKYYTIIYFKDKKHVFTDIDYSKLEKKSIQFLRMFITISEYKYNYEEFKQYNRKLQEESFC